MIKINNKLYNSNLDWNMFYSRGLNKIEKKEYFLYLLKNIKENNNKLNLYIHWEFCKSDCIYCPYLKNLGKIKKKSLKENLNNIKNSILEFIEFLNSYGVNGKDIEIETISYGGGTPSYVPNQYLSQITELLKKKFKFKPKEFTIEINPTNEDYDNILSLKKEGLNRISIGVQTFDKEITKITGRGLKNKDVFSVIEKAHKDFGNINIDMIYGLPNQTLDILERDLDIIISLKEYISHISFYPLYIFPDTILYNNIEFYKKKLPFLKNENNDSFYDYNIVIDYWEKIFKKLSRYFDFYTMDYLVNKDNPDLKHKYQINYLNGKVLYPFGYGYGGGDYIFQNDKNFYIYKNLKYYFQKEILLGIRFGKILIDKNTLDQYFYKIFDKNKIEKDNIDLKEIIVNFGKEKDNIKYQYYLQSLVLKYFTK